MYKNKSTRIQGLARSTFRFRSIDIACYADRHGNWRTQKTTDPQAKAITTVLSPMVMRVRWICYRVLRGLHPSNKRWASCQRRRDL